MADFHLTHPLGDLARLNTKYDCEPISIKMREMKSFVIVFAKKGRADDLMARLGIKTAPSQGDENDDFVALPLSPGQWALRAKSDQGPDFGQKIQRDIMGLGYVSEQSDARVCFEIAGHQARELMSRGCALDLHPSVVSKGFCAQTIMAHMGVLIYQSSDEPIYQLYVYSGFARSFWHWLDETAAQFQI